MTHRTLAAALLAAATLFASSAALAQAAPADAQKTAAAQKLLALWKPESVALMTVQRPAVEAMNQSRIALQGRVTAETQAATLKAIQEDVQAYVDQATPLVQAAAAKDVNPTLVPVLVQNFSLEELQQLIAMFESPTKQKFEKMVPQMARTLGEKIVADTQAQVNPKLKKMTEDVGTKLRKAAGQQ